MIRVWNWKKTIVVHFVLAATVSSGLSLASAPEAHARGGIGKVVGEAQQKKQLIQLIANRIQKHEKMSLDEIKADLIAAVENNRDLLKSRGQLSDEALASIEGSIAEIQRSTSKEELINAERGQINELVSSKNVMFGLTRGLVKGTSDYPVIIAAVIWLTVPLDFVLLPFTFVGSLVTGF